MAKNWNYQTEHEFFSSRGKVKNPRRQYATAKRPVVEQLPGTMAKRGNAYKHTKTGTRGDIPDVIPRSGWEANTMRVFMLHKIKFQFEPREFEFPADVRGRKQLYIPDIYLPDTDEYVEVKGYLDSRGRNKLRKFKKHYREDFDKLYVVISRSNKGNKLFFAKLGVTKVLYYENIADLYSEKVLNWEGKR